MSAFPRLASRSSAVDGLSVTFLPRFNLTDASCFARDLIHKSRNSENCLTRLKQFLQIYVGNSSPAIKVSPVIISKLFRSFSAFAFSPNKSIGLLLTSELQHLQTRSRLQGGKTFCASFCASLIAGSRRAFLCVDSVRLLLEF